MAKKVLLFAPVAFNLAETTRMIEIAKGIRNHAVAREAFDIQFISDGGELEHLIEEEGFALKRMEPRLTPEKIERIGKVDKGEKIGAALSKQEMITRVENEVAYLRQLQPAAVLTGSYMTIPVSCRVAKIPLVWVIQSTWLPDFFARGAGMTDKIQPRPIKAVADWAVLLFINGWIRIGFLNNLNKAARHFGVKGYRSIFDYWRGDVTIVAEPAEFSGVKLPPDHYYTGPLIARQNFPIPDEVSNIAHDKPIIYFAMGSSGTPEIVARIVESFAGKPYRVIAPVKSHLDKVPGVSNPRQRYRHGLAAGARSQPNGGSVSDPRRNWHGDDSRLCRQTGRWRWYAARTGCQHRLSGAQRVRHPRAKIQRPVPQGARGNPAVAARPGSQAQSGRVFTDHG
ncbi:MAG: hypothetical protein M9927_17975 [Anaerolineae bacterium]|nr:hypothetical protein [Anaerolineae bacterium]